MIVITSNNKIISGKDIQIAHIVNNMVQKFLISDNPIVIRLQTTEISKYNEESLDFLEEVIDKQL